MPADLLVFKKKGHKFSAKITKGMRHGHTPENCNINVNIKNYKDLALFFADLEDLWDAPVGKAVNYYKEQKGKILFPF
ncbi:MAG: hypothetical protein ACP5D2_02375 [Candidatus Nanoarchaeia archaeon]